MRTRVCTKDQRVLSFYKKKEKHTCPPEFYFSYCQEKLLWSLEPPGSMGPMGTRSTTWQRKTGCWSTPLMGRGALGASAYSPRMAWPTTRPAPGRGSPKTWWRSSVISTTRWAPQADASDSNPCASAAASLFYDAYEHKQGTRKTVIARAACWILLCASRTERNVINLSSDCQMDSQRLGSTNDYSVDSECQQPE